MFIYNSSITHIYSIYMGANSFLVNLIFFGHFNNVLCWFGKLDCSSKSDQMTEVMLTLWD